MQENGSDSRMVVVGAELHARALSGRWRCVSSLDPMSLSIIISLRISPGELYVHLIEVPSKRSSLRGWVPVTAGSLSSTFIAVCVTHVKTNQCVACLHIAISMPQGSREEIEWGMTSVSDVPENTLQPVDIQMWASKTLAVKSGEDGFFSSLICINNSLRFAKRRLQENINFVPKHSLWPSSVLWAYFGFGSCVMSSKHATSKAHINVAFINKQHVEVPWKIQHCKCLCGDATVHSVGRRVINQSVRVTNQPEVTERTNCDWSLTKSRMDFVRQPVGKPHTLGRHRGWEIKKRLKKSPLVLSSFPSCCVSLSGANL